MTQEAPINQEKNTAYLCSVVSFYRFLSLSQEELDSLISSLKNLAYKFEIKGLIISALEGLNGTVAGPKQGIVDFVKYLNEYSKGEDWKFKYSKSEFMPFKRFTVKFRPEIVTSGNEDLKPNMNDQSHISPKEWHEILEKENDIVLIDVRNDYEVEIGKFKGAIDPVTKDFKEFPRFVEKSGIPKDKKVLMYCTGGIRCEKAYLEMKNLGYENIKQLDGGILRYMELYPDGYFEGECFVFDDRVALNSELRPSTKYSLCPHCGNSAHEFIKCMNCGCQKRVCEKCQAVEARKTCSKNCRYHYELNLKKENKMSQSRGIKDKVLNVLLALLALLFISAPCISQAVELSPEATLKEIVGLIKAKGDPSPVVDFVNWEDSFSKIPDAKKELMAVNSPDDLREFYRRVLISPTDEIERLFSTKFKEKMETEKAQAIISAMKKRTLEKEGEIRARIQKSDYKVGIAQVNGETAVVPLTYTYNKESKTDNVQFVKKGSKWLLTNLLQGMTFKGQKTEQQPPQEQ